VTSVLALAVVIAAPLPKEPAKKPESPALVGTWKCVGMVVGGKNNTADVESGVVFEFTADGKMYLTQNGKPQPDGSFTLDPSKSPAAIDLVMEKDTPTLQAIFRIEADVLTFCFDNGRPDKRPTEFAAPDGTTLMLATFKRLDSKK
jgi:uncharacterized protein (TIGR03067 family)